MSEVERKGGYAGALLGLGLMLGGFAATQGLEIHKPVAETPTGTRSIDVDKVLTLGVGALMSVSFGAIAEQVIRSGRSIRRQERDAEREPACVED
jgi:hypothetical protein